MQTKLKTPASWPKLAALIIRVSSANFCGDSDLNLTSLYVFLALSSWLALLFDISEKGNLNLKIGHKYPSTSFSVNCEALCWVVGRAVLGILRYILLIKKIAHSCLFDLGLNNGNNDTSTSQNILLYFFKSLSQSYAQWLKMIITNGLTVFIQLAR